LALTAVARLAAATWLLVVVPAAAAHSLLLGSVPAARSAIPAPPLVELRFNNRIEKRLSSIALVGAGGARIVATVQPDGPPDRLRASLPALPPGDYRVDWRVLSTDGHVVTGTFTFTVSP
jgi:methionine-rich copper-binding protein CopC